MNARQLTDEEIKYLVDKMKCEFYHTEYHCQNDKGEKWFGFPDEIVGKIIHVDEIFDEYDLRGLREE